MARGVLQYALAV